MKTKPKDTKKVGLRNPALIAGAMQARETQSELIKNTASVVPFLIKTAVFLGLGYFVYTKITNRFVSVSENKNYPTANITQAQATMKAESIYNAMTGFGASLQIVSSNIAGLNYNGFVRLYNAFGKRQGSIPFSEKMTLIEWFTDQFDDQELAQLRFLVPNAF